MRNVLEYAGVCAAIPALVLVITLPAVESSTGRGMLAAILVGVPVQVALFALLVRFRDHPTGFLGAWVGGMVGRLALVGAMAAAVALRDDLPPAATLLTLAGVLFGLLLLEPLFLRKRIRDSGTG